MPLLRTGQLCPLAWFSTGSKRFLVSTYIFIQLVMSITVELQLLSLYSDLHPALLCFFACIVPTLSTRSPFQWLLFRSDTRSSWCVGFLLVCVVFSPSLLPSTAARSRHIFSPLILESDISPKDPSSFSKKMVLERRSGWTSSFLTKSYLWILGNKCIKYNDICLYSPFGFLGTMEQI